VYEVHGVEPADLFEALAGASVNVDTVIQIGSDIVFSVPDEDRADTEDALARMGGEFSEVAELGKVSVVGAGMRSHPGVAASAFGALRDLGIEPRFVSTSPIKISFFVARDEIEQAVRRLHEAFELGDAAAERQHA